MFRCLAITTIAFVTFAASTAHAQAVTRSMNVDYGDLDISRSAGAQALLDRIDHAAMRMCGGKPATFYTSAGLFHPEVGDYQRCHDDAVRNAVASMHSPLLTRLYGGEDAAPARDLIAGR